MRKPAILIIALAMIVNTTNAAFTESTTEKETNNTTTFTAAQQKAAAEFFVTLSRKEYEELSGRHLGLGERLAFKMAQKNVKRQLKRAEEETEGFNLGGFALGLFGSIIGVLIAYLVSQDLNFRRWAWWGFRVSLLIIGAVLLVALRGS